MFRALVLSFLGVILICAPAIAQLNSTTSGGKVIAPISYTTNLSLKQIASGLSYTAGTVAASTSSSIISRKCGYSRQKLTYQELVYWGGSVQTGNNWQGSEVSNDNNESLKAWIEYPTGAGATIGTTTPVTFNSSASGTLNAGAILISDPTYVTIPSNTAYCIVTYIAPNSGHIVYTDGYVLGALCTTCSPGEKSNLGTSGVPTTPAAFTGSDNTSGNSFVSPIAVIAPSTTKAICLLGDSRTQAIKDIGDSSYDIGDLARSVGGFYPYINFGLSGYLTSSFAFGNQGRMPLFQYCDAVIDELGVNELIRSGQVNALLAYKKRVAYLFEGHQGFPAMPYSLTTLEPQSSSSDSFATCTNQTAGTSTIPTYNADVRVPSTYGISTYFDLSKPLEAAAGGGAPGNCLLQVGGRLWFANGTASFYTNDGLHAGLNGNLSIKNTNVILPQTALAASIPTTTNPVSTSLTLVSPTYDTSTPVFPGGALSGGYGSVYNAFPNSLPITVTMWAKLSSSGSNDLRLFTATEPFCSLNPTGVYYVCGQVHGGEIVDTVPANDSTWHYLELDVNYNSTGSTMVDRFCKDGVLVGTITPNVTTSTYNLADNPFVIRSASTLGTSEFPGEIQDVAIYNTSLYANNGNACPSPPVATFSSSTPNLIVGYHLNQNGTAVVGPAGQ